MHFRVQAARAWLDAHPTEVVVFWFSKHGNACVRAHVSLGHIRSSGPHVSCYGYPITAAVGPLCCIFVFLLPILYGPAHMTCVNLLRICISRINLLRGRCGDEYKNVSAAAKQAFWAQVCLVVSGR